MNISLWYSWWWFILLAPWSLLFHIVTQYPIFTTDQFVLKAELFATFKKRLPHGNKVKKVMCKHQCDKHNQPGANDIQWLLWIFWVCCLSPALYNTDCSQLISWFDHYQLQLVYQTVKHHPARKLQHETLQTTLTHAISHSAFSIYCTNLFASAAFLLFLK